MKGESEWEEGEGGWSGVRWGRRRRDESEG